MLISDENPVRKLFSLLIPKSRAEDKHKRKDPHSEIRMNAPCSQIEKTFDLHRLMAVGREKGEY